MADPVHPDTGQEPDRGSPPRMPRWVKVTGIIVGILALLLVVLRLTGVGGEHGPGRHMSGGAAPPASVVEVHAPPAGGLG